MHKTGLFFGSFNPVHIGHLIMAEYFVENTDLQEVWFVVSPRNPLKNKRTLLDDRQRLYLVNLAIGEDERFRACDVELHLPQPSYTCRTLVHLSEQYPKRKFVLLMGSDSLQSLNRWLNYTYILDNYSLYVYPREGYPALSFRNHPHVRWVDAPCMELSATLIRDSIASRHEVRYMLPPKVYDYIDEMGFYAPKPAMLSAKEEKE